MKSLLLSMAAIATYASDDFLITRESINGRTLAPETHYLLIEPLGRKKLFGEATWSLVRGTPMKWQYDNNKIQVMGAFKKKNLCLYWKKNKNSPFDVKACDGMFGGSANMMIGCDTVKIGQFGSEPAKMIGVAAPAVPGDVKYGDEDGNAICSVRGKDAFGAVDDWTEYGSTAHYNGLAAEVKAKTFSINGVFTNDYAQDHVKYMCVHKKSQLSDDVKVGNKKITVNEFEKEMCSSQDRAPLFRWNNKQIEIVYPDLMRIDGKPICLEMGKVHKANVFPFKLQKCDRTVDRGNFGCTSDGYFGTAWNAKRYDQADADGDLVKKAFHADKMTNGLYGNDDATQGLCSFQ